MLQQRIEDGHQQRKVNAESDNFKNNLKNWKKNLGLGVNDFKKSKSARKETFKFKNVLKCQKIIVLNLCFQQSNS